MAIIKKISELEQMEALSDVSNIIIEENGVAKRIAASEIGGGTGTVKSVNGIEPDANGNIEIETGDGTPADFPAFEKVGGIEEYNEIAKATEVSTYEELQAYDGVAILKGYRHESTTGVANESYNIIKIPVQAGDVIRDKLATWWKESTNTIALYYAFFFDSNNTKLSQISLCWDGTDIANYLDIRENGLTAPDNCAYVMLNIYCAYWLTGVTTGSELNGFTANIITVNKDASLTYFDGTEHAPDYVPVSESDIGVYYQATNDVRIPRYEEAINNETETGGGAITGAGEPTDATKGDIGQLYMDTDTNVLYKCVEAKDGAYTWESILGEGHYEIGTNKFNVDTITEGKFIWASYNTTGSSPVYSDNAEQGLSDWIEVDEGDSYVFHSDEMSSAQSLVFVFVDEDGILVADGYAAKVNESFVIPAGCVKCRFSAKLIFLQNGTAQLEKGTVRTPYEPYTSTYVSATDFTGIENYEPLVTMVDEKVNAHVPEMASEAKAGVARIWTTDNGDGTVDLHIDTTGEV